MQLAEVKGHAGIATLIRNKKQRQAGSGKAITDLKKKDYKLLSTARTKVLKKRKGG
jgi:hypothetical protein